MKKFWKLLRILVGRTKRAIQAGFDGVDTLRKSKLSVVNLP